jgi:hypothetical protein
MAEIGQWTFIGAARRSKGQPVTPENFGVMGRSSRRWREN